MTMTGPKITRRGRRAPVNRQALRAAREDRALSIPALAAAATEARPDLPLSKSQLSAVERGVNGISPERLAVLADVLRPRSYTVEAFYATLLLPADQRGG